MPLGATLVLELLRTSGRSAYTLPTRRKVPLLRRLKNMRTRLSKVSIREVIERIASYRLQDLATLDFHTMSIDEAEQRFTTSVKDGLDSDQVSRRLKSNGPNAISKPPNKLWKK